MAIVAVRIESPHTPPHEEGWLRHQQKVPFRIGAAETECRCPQCELRTNP